MEVRRRVTGYDGVRTLERVPLEYGVPRTIRVDNGPEFVSREGQMYGPMPTA